MANKFQVIGVMLCGLFSATELAHCEFILDQLKIPYEQLSTLPPEKAALRFKGWYIRHGRGDDGIEIRKALAAELVKNPNIQSYFEELYTTTPRYQERHTDLAWTYRVLGNLKTSWSVALLGKELSVPNDPVQPGMSKQEIIQRVKADPQYLFDYPRAAAKGLALLNLEGSPAQIDPRKPQRRNADYRQWREWWDLNGERVVTELAREEGLSDEEIAHLVGKPSRPSVQRTPPREPKPLPPLPDVQKNETSIQPPKSALLIAGSLILLAMALAVYLKVRSQKNID